MNSQPWLNIPPTGPMLRPRDAAEYVGLSLPTYYQLAKKGELPVPSKIGVHSSGVPRPWLDAVINARVSASKVGG